VTSQWLALHYFGVLVGDRVVIPSAVGGVSCLWITLLISQ
jgi:hypothetical protein